MLRALIVATALASASGAEETMTFDALLDQAKNLETARPDSAEQAYKDMIFKKKDLDDPMWTGTEAAINALGRFYVARHAGKELIQLITDLRPVFAELPQRKAAHFFDSSLDLLVQIKGTDAEQIVVCQQLIERCMPDKRDFLRHRIETRLASLYLAQNKYASVLSLLSKLIPELEKLDDKLLLVDIYLIECKYWFALRNIPKSQASLVAAKTSAEAIQCPPLQWAEIDHWTRMAVAPDETDWANTMMELVSKKDAWAMGVILVERPGLVRIRSRDGRGPLFWAYQYGNAEMVQTLLDAGADPDLCDENGMRPEDLKAGENRRLVVV